MQKGKISIILGSIILISLLIFISTKNYDDGHLRIEGVRVKVPDHTLTVEECNTKNQNVAYCEKELKVNDQNVKLVFAYKNFKENGYPSLLVGSINGHEFFKKENLNLEVKGSEEYSTFNNFKVMDNYIVFTYTDGTNGRTTTLYALDLDGNIVLEEKEIDKDDMAIKDYTTFISYDQNVITIYATRMVQDIVYKDENICKAKNNDIVEAYYNYTLKDGKFTKKQTKTVTAQEFIANKKITCSN